MHTIKQDHEATRIHRKTSVTLLIGLAGLLLIAAGTINEMLLKVSIDRARAFLNVEADLSKACALKTPCEWLNIETVRQGGFVLRSDIEALALGEDYVIEVSEEGDSATARPKGFFWGYAPNRNDIDGAYKVAVMSSDDFTTTPAIFSH